MFDSSFSHASQTTINPSIPDEDVISLLHDFGSIIHLNPDCKGYQKADSEPKGSSVPVEAEVYDCQDALTFIPKKLWDGGVWYKAIYALQPKGCDITVKAPGGFSSINRWRLQVDNDGNKSMSIDSDAKCNRTFAIFVEKFLQSSHDTQHRRFKEKLDERTSAANGKPGMPRRRSSWRY
ncbi:hypothetical protein B9Z65_7089 [Elsinoe australis]|uniref:DUF7053 domain-containing protein n=1 Tax=Elsinoe australis TaxID=40998 RepID=A0A2P7Z4J5_9PEZI|nr:hypothetical protein B9Z65_7089 [Elsinoe australis]